ncbi:lasso peptide biosynthesis B2 protein [Acidithiobacillus sulfuriphilus]|uniref:lasso peptide biosynthesis B2 protein n=1 Tax=Acidithiobacillus sulfuriphilus TaxID=1867749 RepID=UPI003F63A825
MIYRRITKRFFTIGNRAHGTVVANYFVFFDLRDGSYRSIEINDVESQICNSIMLCDSASNIMGVSPAISTYNYHHKFGDVVGAGSAMKIPCRMWFPSLVRYLRARIRAQSLYNSYDLGLIKTLIAGTHAEVDNLSEYKLATIEVYARIFKTFHTILSPNATCLISSISGLLFFQYNDIQTSIIFGVKVDPFRAHCWLEWNKMIINEPESVVAEYSPIFVIKGSSTDDVGEGVESGPCTDRMAGG